MTPSDHLALSAQDTPNEGPWMPAICPTCYGACRARVVGLHGEKPTTERETTGVDPDSESDLMAALVRLRGRKAQKLRETGGRMGHGA